jgi:hypothetical protein
VRDADLHQRAGEDEPGLLEDLPPGGVVERLALVDTTAGNLCPGVGVVDVVEDEDLAPGALPPEDVGRRPDPRPGRGTVRCCAGHGHVPR